MHQTSPFSISVLFLAVGFALDCNTACTILCTVACISSSIGWIRLSSFVSIDSAFLFTISILTNNEAERTKEITETTSEHLLILPHSVFRCFLQSMSVLPVIWRRQLTVSLNWKLSYYPLEFSVLGEGYHLLLQTEHIDFLTLLSKLELIYSTFFFLRNRVKLIGEG